MNLALLHIFSVASGGAIGAVMRYSVSLACLKMIGAGFPWGTMAVNVIGSFIMGVLFIAFSEDYFPVSQNVKLFAMTGMMGAFTTFSTFSLDAWNLASTGKVIEAGVYIAFSVMLSIIALLCGVFLIKNIIL